MLLLSGIVCKHSQFLSTLTHTQIHVRALVRRSQEDGAALVTTFWCTYTPIDKTAVVTPVHPATQAELQDWQQARGYARQNEQTVRQMESA